MREKFSIPEGALDVQREFIYKIASLNNKPASYHIVTLGCQMNARDSETIAGMFEEMGMHSAATRE